MFTFEWFCSNEWKFTDCMGNNQITGLSDPSANDHAVNQKYVNDNYLSLYGNNQMGSTLDMNDNRTTGLTTDILYLLKLSINSTLIMRL